jgi:hypothetical protein
MPHHNAQEVMKWLVVIFCPIKDKVLLLCPIKILATLSMFENTQTRESVAGIELAASRDIKTSLPALVRLTGSDTDAKVRR